MNANVNFADLVAAYPAIGDVHKSALDLQLELCKKPKVIRCKNGTYTIRLVWRNRKNHLSTITHTLRGVRLQGCSNA